MSAFLFVFCFFSCKTYSPSFDIDNFYTEYNQNVDFVEAESYVVLMPKNDEAGVFPETGIIFYPGGLVDYHAYLPLMELCAKEEIACFILKMPMDFAFMDKKAADKFPLLHPEIKNWYMAGHSLGGAMAASYLYRHKKNFKGLILLASFSTKNLSHSNLKVLSIYGSEDKVLNLEHYQKNKRNLPQVGNGLTEIIIDGGNHAQFAAYGPQEGDGVAEITAEEQQQITANEIVQWINGRE